MGFFTTALALGGALGAGAFMGGGGGSGSDVDQAGMLEVGTSDKYKTKKEADVDTTTTTISPFTSRINAPQIQKSKNIFIKSPGASAESKKEASSKQQPSQRIPIITTPKVGQAEQTGSGGGSGLLGGDVKGLIILGGVGYVAYKMLT